MTISSLDDSSVQYVLSNTEAMMQQHHQDECTMKKQERDQSQHHECSRNGKGNTQDAKHEVPMAWSPNKASADSKNRDNCHHGSRKDELLKDEEVDLDGTDDDDDDSNIDERFSFVQEYQLLMKRAADEFRKEDNYVAHTALRYSEFRIVGTSSTCPTAHDHNRVDEDTVMQQQSKMKRRFHDQTESIWHYAKNILQTEMGFIPSCSPVPGYDNVDDDEFITEPIPSSSAACCMGPPSHSRHTNQGTSGSINQGNKRSATGRLSPHPFSGILNPKHPNIDLSTVQLQSSMDIHSSSSSSSSLSISSSNSCASTKSLEENMDNKVYNESLVLSSVPIESDTLQGFWMERVIAFVLSKEMDIPSNPVHTRMPNTFSASSLERGRGSISETNGESSSSTELSSSLWRIVYDPRTHSKGLLVLPNVNSVHGTNHRNYMPIQEAMSLSNEARILVLSTPPYAVVHVNKAYLQLVGLSKSAGNIIGQPIENTLCTVARRKGRTHDQEENGCKHLNENEYWDSTIQSDNNRPCTIRLIPVCDRSKRQKRCTGIEPSDASNASYECASHFLIQVYDGRIDVIPNLDDDDEERMTRENTGVHNEYQQYEQQLQQQHQQHYEMRTISVIESEFDSRPPKKNSPFGAIG